MMRTGAIKLLPATPCRIDNKALPKSHLRLGSPQQDLALNLRPLIFKDNTASLCFKISKCLCPIYVTIELLRFPYFTNPVGFFVKILQFKSTLWTLRPRNEMPVGDNELVNLLQLTVVLLIASEISTIPQDLNRNLLQIWKRHTKKECLG